MKTCKARMCRQLVKQTLASASADSLLCGPPHGYQEEHFLRSTYPCGPKSGSQTTSEINVQNYITLKGGIALERSHRLPRVNISTSFHKPIIGN